MVDAHERTEKDEVELMREQAEKDVSTLTFWQHACHTAPIALIMAMREQMAEVMRDILPMI